MNNLRITSDILSKKKSELKEYIYKFNVKRNNHSLFCFVEGYDCDYYYDKVRYICNDDLEFIKCGNKSNTLEAYNRYFTKFKGKVKMAFLIDRDFDVSNTSPGICETEGYSIENYYCAWNEVSKFLEHGLHVNKNNEDWNYIEQFYKSNSDQFHDVVGELNAFYSLFRKYNREHNEKLKCCFGDKFDKNFGEIKIGKFSKKYCLQDLFDKYTYEQALFSQEDVDKEKERLSKNASKKFRGKYEIEFVENFLIYLINDANGAKKIIKNNKIKSNIFSNSFMRDFSQYAYYPESLKKYLTDIWNNGQNNI